MSEQRGRRSLPVGGLIEFDSKNNFVLDLDSGDGGPAVSSRAAYFDRERSGLSIQPVP